MKNLKAIGYREEATAGLFGAGTEMKSMTGYGAVERRTPKTEVSVVVKSVNGRFLEPRFHLPKEYFQIEAQLKRELANAFSRGTVDVFVYRRGAGDLKVHFNRKNAGRWVEAHRELARAIGVPFDADQLLERLSSLPQVFELREPGGPAPDEKRLVVQAFRDSLKKCQSERQREGKSLQKHLLRILGDLKKTVGRIMKLRTEVAVDLENKLRDRLLRFKNDAALEPTRFAQELVYYLDKSDISEELARLDEHLHMCSRYVRGREAQGKKLDFYGQELLREINTIGSKANHAQLTEMVVEAKGLIEAFKEQVQNIE